MILAINKPKGPTSHDIIDTIRRKTGEKKVGHAGILDPLASGVLVVAIGSQDTKKLSSIVKKEKEYLATIELGKKSTTDDSEGKIEVLYTDAKFSQKDIKDVIQQFIGIVQQIPPVYSAIKIHGTPSHRRVRKGESVELKPREVEIKNIEIESYSWPYLKLRVTTGPGVYIRALARDIGKKLKTGGYLSELERVRVGEYTLETAITVDSINYK